MRSNLAPSFPARTSATAEPRPPIIECSSSVTIPLHFAFIARIVSASIGLTVCILTTAAEIPSASSISAAFNATGIIRPIEIIHTSVPSFMMFALPGMNGSSGFVISSQTGLATRM